MGLPAVDLSDPEGLFLILSHHKFTKMSTTPAAMTTTITNSLSFTQRTWHFSTRLLRDSAPGLDGVWLTGANRDVGGSLDSRVLLDSHLSVRHPNMRGRGDVLPDRTSHGSGV